MIHVAWMKIQKLRVGCAGNARVKVMGFMLSIDFHVVNLTVRVLGKLSLE